MNILEALQFPIPVEEFSNPPSREQVLPKLGYPLLYDYQKVR